ncbi:hypothetical protein K7432_002063 [Basidiobolus ranarum]|uniref:Uncharacterized protein n=1 Tax=Basidiobolus ranarum TaxID=34480 RepID=A0ABR2X233_9FUNG
MLHLKYQKLLTVLVALVGLTIAIQETEYCQILPSTSKFCHEVNYPTTIKDVEAADASIKESLNRMSREGYDNAGAVCILAIRRALCYMTYKYCDIETHEIHSICPTVRQRAVTICNDSHSFTDISVIDENINSTLFRQEAGCYPDSLEIDKVTNNTSSILPSDLSSPTSTLAEGILTATVKPTTSTILPTTPSHDADVSNAKDESTSTVKGPEASTFTDRETTRGNTALVTGASDGSPMQTTEVQSVLKYRQGILNDLASPPVDEADPAYSFASSLLAIILVLVIIGSCVVATLAFVFHNRRQSFWNISKYGRYKKMEDEDIYPEVVEC